MAYEIEYFGAVFREDIPKLSNEMLARIEEAIKTKLTIDPSIFEKPLRMSLRKYRSLRVGDYRIVYRVKHSMVTIVAMRHRKDAYEQAGRRV